MQKACCDSLAVIGAVVALDGTSGTSLGSSSLEELADLACKQDKLCLRQSRSARSCKPTISFSSDCLTALSIDSDFRIRNSREQLVGDSLRPRSKGLWGAHIL